MTGTLSTSVTPELRCRIEDFLYAEAALLDDWRLDDWLELLTDDAHYEVPSLDERGGEPSTMLMLIADDRDMVTARVKRLNSRKAHREFPWSRTRRLIGNVRVLAQDPDGIRVTYNVVVHRTRRATNAYVGRAFCTLVEHGDSFRMSYRRVELEMETLDPHGTLSIII